MHLPPESVTNLSAKSDQGSSDIPISLGVLLVHGIGTQRRGETLVTWLDAIVRTINSATRGQAVATVDWAHLGTLPARDDATPPNATVRILADGVAEHWIVAEAWWAETFAAPSFAQLVSWSFRAIPWTIAMHALQRYASHEEHPVRSRLIVQAWGAAQALVMLFLAPFIVSALGLLLLVGLIPIDGVRRVVGQVQRALAATAGDSMAYLESPTRSAAMCTAVSRALAWLHAACGPGAPARTVILAHSQGATVSVETLQRIANCPAGATSGLRRASGSELQACVLVTFGAGVNKLAALRVLAANESNATHKDPVDRDPIRLASLSLLGLAIVSGWLWHLSAVGHVTPRQLWVAPAVGFASLLLFGLAVTGGQWLIRTFGESRPWLKTAVWSTILVLFFGINLGYLVLAYMTDTPLPPFFVLVASLTLLLGAFAGFLRQDMQTRLVDTIPVLSNVGKWLDYWASADPVPNGKTQTSLPGVPTSCRIWNESSLFRDHGAYWQNFDGFTLSIVHTLTRTAQSEWSSRLPSVTGMVDARCRWRTGWLKLARWTVPAVFLIIGVYRGADLEAIRLNLAASVKSSEVMTWLSWVPSSLWAFAFRWGVVLAAGWLAYRILLAIWHAWVRVEQERVLWHLAPVRIHLGLRIFGAVTCLFVGGALLVARTEWTTIQALSSTFTIEGFVPFVFGVGVGGGQMLVWLGAKLFPPPQ